MQEALEIQRFVKSEGREDCKGKNLVFVAAGKTYEMLFGRYECNHIYYYYINNVALEILNVVIHCYLKHLQCFLWSSPPYSG